MLSGINSPEDLKRIPEDKLPDLATEIRKKIIDVVGKNGGHLASNLGVVELTIALHRVFTSPNDAFVFDVSHQCYTHKLLTGRYKDFESLRTFNGISGFTKKAESEHDFFDNGHSSTSISQALGLLSAWQLQGRNDKVVAIIGDGALTGGMAFEALSHAGQIAKNLIVVLNDNQMSISKNTGSLSKYLSRLTMTGTYQRFRKNIDKIVEKIPNLSKFIFRIKRGLKGVFFTNNLFTDLGFEYVGPLNGHDIKELEDVLNRVKNLSRPVVVHVLTKKGKGYSPAENDPAKFHGIGPFLISDGNVEKYDTLSFTESFSRTLIRLAEKNDRIVAITAAMAKGTGLDAFARKFPSRFYDVGIAEEHAVSFASGLAAGNLIPIVAIYSTFIQRSIDQIIHDISVQNFPIVFCLDRAGPVPNDGETHQGIFDIALLRPIPNLSILSPGSGDDLKVCLEWSINSNKAVSIRYPKTSCPSEIPIFASEIQEGRGILIKSEEYAPSLAIPLENSSKRILFVCTGGIYSEVVQASRALLMENIYSDVYTLRFIKPIDEEYFYSVVSNYSGVCFVEDGVKVGGISEYLSNVLAEKKYTNTIIKAFPNSYFPQGTRTQICEYCKMSSKDICNAAKSLLE